MTELRTSRRLQRLREHHDQCARRYEETLLLTQSLGATDESESDSDDGSEYVPTPASSDSEDCSLGEGPDFPKDTEMRVNKINTTSTQKVDELESDSSDLELTIDEVDDGKEEELFRSPTHRPDPDEPSDSDKDSDGPGTHTKTRVKRLSKTKRSELSRSPKHRPDPDEPSDSDKDSDGPGTHTKTKVKRSSKTKRSGSAMQKKAERRPWSDGEKKAVWEIT